MSVCVYMYLCLGLCMYVCVCVSVCVYVYVCVSMCVCISLFVCVCVYICHGTRLEVIEQLEELDPLLLRCGSWSSGLQA